MEHNVEKTWKTEAGYIGVCIIIKNMHRCGYVGLLPNHPLHGIEYNQSTEKLKSLWEKIKEGSEEEPDKRGPIITLLAACDVDSPDNWSPDRVCNIHGGLTYSGGNQYPIKSEENLWWFGFDCGHAGDGYLDGDMKRFSSGPVRTTEYVITECESLAKQLKAMEQ